MPRTKNGPALAAYGAITMKNALGATMGTLPQQLRRSVTWDRGKQLSTHAQFKVDTGVPAFFPDPHSPWQRGTNENTYGCKVKLARDPFDGRGCWLGQLGDSENTCRKAVR